MTSFKKTIESSVPVPELDRYFHAIAEKREGNRFIGPGWTVEFIRTQEVRMGMLTLPRTRLLFQGSPEAVTALVSEFRMRFLSAGG